jgi:hypothetical protein
MYVQVYESRVRETSLNYTYLWGEKASSKRETRQRQDRDWLHEDVHGNTIYNRKLVHILKYRRVKQMWHTILWLLYYHHKCCFKNGGESSGVIMIKALIQCLPSWSWERQTISNQTNKTISDCDTHTEGWMGKCGWGGLLRAGIQGTPVLGCAIWSENES